MSPEIADLFFALRNQCPWSQCPFLIQLKKHRELKEEAPLSFLMQESRARHKLIRLDWHVAYEIRFAVKMSDVRKT